MNKQPIGLRKRSGYSMSKNVKFILMCCLFLLFIATAVGCARKQKNTENVSSEKVENNDSSSEEAKNDDTAVEEVEDVCIETEYYSITIPKSWEDDCFYEIVKGEGYGYALHFNEKTSYDEIGGGWLFSIELFTEFEDYTYLPSYDILGSLEVYRIGSYNIVVIYPTDVQFTETTMEKYEELERAVPDVLDTITFKKECVFSKEPLKVIQEEKPQISKNFIGKWRDLGIGSSAPAGATRWDVEFRSDGTGTFEFVFGPNEIKRVDFEFSPFDTYLGETMDGIFVRVDSSRDIKYMAKYTWSNELQKMLMTMYEVTSDGAPNLNCYWVYSKE